MPLAENLLNREFRPAAPDRVWPSDITYVATDDGSLYLVAVIVLSSREVVGWAPSVQAVLAHEHWHLAGAPADAACRRPPARGARYRAGRLRYWRCRPLGLGSQPARPRMHRAAALPPGARRVVRGSFSAGSAGPWAWAPSAQGDAGP